MSTTFHCTFEIGYLLQQPDKKLAKMLVDSDGKRVSAGDLRAHLIEQLRKGYDYLPVCDNPGKDGMCAGHPNEDEALTDMACDAMLTEREPVDPRAAAADDDCEVEL